MSVVPVTLRDSFFSDRFFQSSWEDFESIRREMLKESKEFWDNVERNNQEMMKNMTLNNNNNNMIQSSSTSSSSTSAMKNSNCENANNSKNIETNTKGGTALQPIQDDGMVPWFVPRRWMFPNMFSNDMTSSMSQQTNGADTSTRIPISNFWNSFNRDDQIMRTKEDDTKIDVSIDTHGYRPEDIKVNIMGNVISVEGKHEEKSDNRTASKQFSRKFTIADNCDPSRVTSNLSSDGILMITTPKKEVNRIQGEQRAIPITLKQ